MANPFADVCLARLPLSSLAALAVVRALPGAEVRADGAWAWVRWEAGQDAVLRRVLPVAGAELYEAREGKWYRHGAHLPAFDVPDGGNFRPLHQVLFPAPVSPLPGPARRPWQPVRLGLVPEPHPRPARALECTGADLGRWVDRVPSARLKALGAARCGGRILLLGERLPPVAGERFWGASVLVPLGLRPEPALPEAALREALGAGEDDLLLLRRGADGPEVEAVPRSALEPLTRAGLRLALRGAP